jgi:hypothetical protein
MATRIYVVDTCVERVRAILKQNNDKMDLTVLKIALRSEGFSETTISTALNQMNCIIRQLPTFPKSCTIESAPIPEKQF